jgi:hypothetical protein
MGNCEIVTPFVAARLTERSCWMTLSKWTSSMNANGELAVKSIGKGVVEKLRVKGLAVGVSWHTVLLRQALAPVPIVAPDPL